jgi:hypothetical protein
LCASLAVACACPATDVGTFADSRLYLPQANNIVTGSQMTMLKAIWQARGAVWHQTDALTTGFLSGVTVFVTGNLGTNELSQDERNALLAWVKAGGTLVVTGECLCWGGLPTYNSMLSLFGVGISESGWHDWGQVVTSNRITLDLTRVFIAGDGFLAVPPSATPLFLDSLGNLSGALMDKTPETGNGRLLVTGDTDMLTDPYLTSYPENRRLADGMAAWAIGPFSSMSGHVSLAWFPGDPTTVRAPLKLYHAGALVDITELRLDSSGDYSATVLNSGVCNALAKPTQWLAVKQAVDTSGAIATDWDFAINGDANNSNSIGVLDLSVVLMDFGTVGPSGGDLNGDGVVTFRDLGVILLNFGSVGDTGP